MRRLGPQDDSIFAAKINLTGLARGLPFDHLHTQIIDRAVRQFDDELRQIMPAMDGDVVVDLELIVQTLRVWILQPVRRKQRVEMAIGIRRVKSVKSVIQKERKGD